MSTNRIQMNIRILIDDTRTMMIDSERVGPWTQELVQSGVRQNPDTAASAPSASRVPYSPSHPTRTAPGSPRVGGATTALSARLGALLARSCPLLTSLHLLGGPLGALSAAAGTNDGAPKRCPPTTASPKGAPSPSHRQRAASPHSPASLLASTHSPPPQPRGPTFTSSCGSCARPRGRRGRCLGSILAYSSRRSSTCAARGVAAGPRASRAR